jgi:hypothetical protein
LEVEYQHFPLISSRFTKDLKIASRFGCFMFFLPYMLTFIQTVSEILREKEKKLRLGVVVMGVGHDTYWIS